MKKIIWRKIILILALVLSAVISCSVNTQPTELSTNNYFDIKYGDKWYYNSYHIHDTFFDSTKYDLLWEVIDENILDGKSFFKIEATNYNRDGEVKRIDTMYYSFSSDTLFHISAGNLFNKSSIQLRAIFDSQQAGKFVVKADSSGDYIGYLQTKNDSTYTFSYYQDKWMDSGWQTTYKANVGIIESHSGWGFGIKLVKFERL